MNSIMLWNDYLGGLEIFQGDDAAVQSLAEYWMTQEADVIYFYATLNTDAFCDTDREPVCYVGGLRTPCAVTTGCRNSRCQPEWVDNSVAYAGNDGQHGLYGRPSGATGPSFCDITGCFGRRDDCKLKLGDPR